MRGVGQVAFVGFFVVSSLVSLPLSGQSLPSYSDVDDMTDLEILDELITLNERERMRLEAWESRLIEREIDLQQNEQSIATLAKTTGELASSLRSSERERLETQKSRDFWVTATVVALVAAIVGFAL